MPEPTREELIERLAEFVADKEQQAYTAFSIHRDPPGAWRGRLNDECPEWLALICRGRQTLEAAGVELPQPEPPPRKRRGRPPKEKKE